MVGIQWVGVAGWDLERGLERWLVIEHEGVVFSQESGKPLKVLSREVTYPIQIYNDHFGNCVESGLEWENQEATALALSKVCDGGLDQDS